MKKHNAFKKWIYENNSVNLTESSLGKTGISVSFIGFGTGTNGSNQVSDQTRLGTEEFSKLVKYALDHGVYFFDVADQYGSHVFLRQALKGIDRDKYVIQTKTRAESYEDAKSCLERYLLELGTDYIDILLLHCMEGKDWPEQYKGTMDYLREAKQNKLILAHGVSCHGLSSLKVASKNSFTETCLVPINPEKLSMNDDADPEKVMDYIEKMHNEGIGTMGMKLIGNGEIKNLDKSLALAIESKIIDSIVIGFKSVSEIDDLIKRTNKIMVD